MGSWSEQCRWLAAAAIAIFVGLPTATAVAVAPTFSAGPGSPYTLGTNSRPVDVAAGDFNGDGKVDLVTANQVGNSVSVLLATNGEGQFAAHSDVTVPDGPTALAVGDLNGDGRDDVAVVSTGPAAPLSVLLGTPSGLGSPSSKTLAGQGSDVAMGDVTGDGKLDVLATSGADVEVFPGNGAGGLGSPVPYTTCGSSNGDLSVGFADATGDGKADIVAACVDKTARVLPGNGAGSYGTAVVAPATGTSGAAAVHLAIADMNEDGHPDLLLPDSNISKLGLLLGNGSGGFSAAPGSPFTPASGGGGTSGGSGPADIGVADLNGDGHLDVAMDAPAADAARVLLGDGSGGFDATSGAGETGHVGSLVSVSPSTTPFGIAVADLNGDGKPDIATSNNTSNDLTVLLNTTPTPSASTKPAGDVTSGSATLNGVVNPEGLPTTYRFEYGTTTAYGSQTPVFPTGGSLTGTADQAVSAPVSGLSPGTTYHFRLVAINGDGTTRGRDRTFKTAIPAPVNSVRPRITGTPKVGARVSCQRGTWSGSPTFAYRWLLNGDVVAGQKLQTFKLPKSAALKALQCAVTAKNASGSATALSKPVVVIPVTCTVPAVQGNKLGKAKKRVRKAGCAVGKVSRAHSTTVKKGRVISQTPAPGTKVGGGTKVKLVVSSGP